jgi:ribosomal protein L19E
MSKPATSESSKQGSKSSRRKSKDLKTQTIEMLRRKLRASEEERISVKARLRECENALGKFSRTAKAAEDELEAWMDAVRVLAEQVSNTTGAGRRARVEARQILEAKKIRPPHSLGTSRNRKKASKKKT